MPDCPFPAAGPADRTPRSETSRSAPTESRPLPNWRSRRSSPFSAAGSSDNQEARLAEQTRDRSDAVAVEVAHLLGELLPRHQVRRPFLRDLTPGSGTPALPEALLNPTVVLKARKRLDLTRFELNRLTPGLLSGCGLASDGGELPRDVAGLVPVRRPERFVELSPGAKGSFVLRKRTIRLATADVVRVDCPGDQLGIGRRPGVGQLASKRLSSITAILARVTARGFASGVGFWEGPASLYTTTSPQRTAQPET